MSNIKELLQISDEEVRLVRKQFRKAEEDINDAVNILLDWLEKQPHLPKPHDKVRLERILLRNKFRIEQTKSKLDHYYTFKSLHPEFYRLDPDSSALQNLKKSVIMAPMSKLLPGLERLFCCHFVKNEENNYNILDKFQYLILYWELQLSHDYSSADVYVWDVKYLNIKHVLKLDINLMQKGFAILRQAFSGRMSHIHFINVPSWFDIVMNIFGKTMHAKLFGKIRIHKDLDSLYQAIPKECLPEEFGGNAGTLTKLCDEWSEELKLQKDFFESIGKKCSNERLRIGKPIQNDLFGIEGTFRKINLD